MTESAKQSPLQVTASSTEQVQAVIAFGARYYSGGPFQDPVKVLLKVHTLFAPSTVHLLLIHSFLRVSSAARVVFNSSQHRTGKSKYRPSTVHLLLIHSFLRVSSAARVVFNSSQHCTGKSKYGSNLTDHNRYCIVESVHAQCTELQTGYSCP